MYGQYIKYLRWYKVGKERLIKRLLVKQNSRPIVLRPIWFGAKKSWSSPMFPVHSRPWSLTCFVVMRVPEAVLNHNRKHKAI
jgi:hypothetical protein